MLDHGLVAVLLDGSLMFELLQGAALSVILGILYMLRIFTLRNFDF